MDLWSAFVHGFGFAAGVAGFVVAATVGTAVLAAFVAHILRGGRRG